MTIQTIKMPDIGEGIAEVELVAWHVSVGEVVAEDQILADVMTDKATVEIPSHVAGTIVSLDCPVGQIAAVGAEIIRIEVAGEHCASVPVAQTPAAQTTADDQSSKSDAAKKTAQPLGIASSASLHSSSSVTAVPDPSAAQPDLRKVLAAPAVRQRATRLGLDLAQISGSGVDGHITHADLDALLSLDAGSVLSASSAPSSQTQDRETALPVIGLRRKIAQKMQDAKRRIPHFTYVEEIDVTELEALRARLNAEYSASRGRLTLLPFLVRAMVLAIADHPEVNARYDDEAALLTRHSAVHMGIATQTENGLMVPVLRHAQALDLWGCAKQVLRLSEAARTGKAAREELSGSTITLTSLGALGGIVSTPVINHPEVAIVGTNRIVERPMIVAGAVVARKMMNLSSSFDHRVVDGMNAAEFIQLMRGYLECPARLWLT